MFPVVLIVFSIQIFRSDALCSRRGVECVEYQVLSRTPDYEERQYPGTTWVSTTADGSTLAEAQRIMYKKLIEYYRGSNIDGIAINSTTPARIRIIPCRGATCYSTFTMSFPIPADMKENVPYPLDPTVFIDREPPLRYVTRSFTGRPTEEEWLDEAHKFAGLVWKDPTVEKNYFYILFYDPPFQLFNRLNEIALLKKIEVPISTTAPPNELEH
ncbi:heme-binding protein 1-like [Centruroides vittatus]|uniref:heme-binding protein 1-like n=1 Tax=Centruroides vittatus TaxID=120091 RepID=UPI003510C365